MAELRVVQYGASVLRRPAQPVGNDLHRFHDVVLDMFDTMRASHGVGLAAPQVGLSWQIIVVDMSMYDAEVKPIALINPVILERQGSERGLEGCLSLPDLEVEVTRAERIRVSAHSLDGQRLEFPAEGLLARIIQHEVDHLQGKLLVDFLPRWRRWLYALRCQLRGRRGMSGGTSKSPVQQDAQHDPKRVAL